ncbi:hypothetical protein Tco_0643881 [Tanacetum coccineum]
MSTANQQTLAKFRTEGRPPILEKGRYVPWASRFLRFLDNKRDEGALMWNSNDNGPYKQKEIDDPNNAGKKMYDPIKDLSTEDRDKYYADIKLSQSAPHVYASRAKKVAINHDLLALFANSYAPHSYYHASPSYSRSSQPYYVTHLPSVHDYDDDYQWEIQGDAQKDKLSNAMILLARVITQN